MKERTGSSSQAIKKWILENAKDVNFEQRYLRAALSAGVKNGSLKQIKASYRVVAKAKKAKVAKAAAAAPAKAKKAPAAKAAKPAAKTGAKPKAKKAAAKKVILSNRNVLSIEHLTNCI